MAQHTHDVYDTGKHFEINGISRFIKETSATKLVLVQGDHNSEVITFQMPRYIDGHDMLLCNKIRVHYINLDTKTNDKSADIYEVTDLALCEECEEETLTFTWKIEAPATKYCGSLAFLIKFECTEGDSILYQWNTARYVSVNVLAGIDNSEEFVDKYSNVLEEWYNELTKGADSIEELNQQAIAEIELAKEDAKEDIQGKAISTMDAMEQFCTDTFETFNSDVNRKAEETLNMIPDDYSKLDAEVKTMKTGKNIMSKRTETLVTIENVGEKNQTLTSRVATVERISDTEISYSIVRTVADGKSNYSVTVYEDKNAPMCEFGVDCVAKIVYDCPDLAFKFQYGLFDENKNKIGNTYNVRMTDINGIYEITTDNTDVKYISIYSIVLDAETTLNVPYSVISCTVTKTTNNSEFESVFGDSLAERLPNIESKVLETEKRLSDYGSAVTHNDCYLYRKILPEYYFSTSATPMSFEDNEYLEQKISEIPKGKSFIFITDTHWASNYKNSTPLMQYVKKRTGIKTILFGGDILNSKETAYLGNLEMKTYMNEMVGAFGEDYLVCIGNHDLNSAHSPDAIIPYRVARSTLLNHLNEVVTPYDASLKLAEMNIEESDLEDLKAYFACNYYYDDVVNRIRYIVINTGFVNNGIVENYFGMRGVNEMLLLSDWIADTLKSTKNGFDVVFVGHQFVSNTLEINSGQNTRIAQLLTGRKALVNNVSIGWSSFGGIETPFFDTGSRIYDFSDCEPIGNIFVINGHYHCDANSFYTKYDTTLLAITTQCDAGKTSLGTNYEKGQTYEMTGGTVTEQCFDVVTITEDNHVVCTRFGAGSDRDFDLNN